MLVKAKKLIYGLWVLVVVMVLLEYVANPKILSPQYLQTLIEHYSGELMFVYITVSLTRGFFLIPSTPFVLLGGLLFPDRLGTVLLISMAGVMSSATSLYYFSDLLGFSTYFESRYPAEVGTWKSRLANPRSVLFVIGWSFFPLVPTDLICYVAGIISMPFRYLFVGVFVGELVLNVIYLYFF